MLSFVVEDRSPVFKKRELKSFVKELISLEGFQLGDISLVFCSDEKLLSINKEYLDHDYYTDIITFDYCVLPKISGDLMISVDRIEDNAISNKVSFLLEFHRVVFHGVLHLCGYKDKSKKDISVMRSKENFYLNHFGLE